MRLLHVQSFEFKVFPSKIPPYAILSHRWTECEASLADIQRCRPSSTSFSKIYNFARYIAQHFPNLEWIWVDSCCIKQESAAELSEAINCMFDWYRDAKVCIAYLPDVEHPSDRGALRDSVWFTRGWTLQELVASSVVIFVTNSWQVIGHKGIAKHFEDKADIGLNLEPFLSGATGIPQAVLQDFQNSHEISNEEKMRWMQGRETLKEEDMYYALFGIFGVTPGANYGEKKSGAARRLFEAIERKEHFSSGHFSTGQFPQTPSAMHMIPFPRDPKFLERKELGLVREKLSEPGARVALVGLGGIGKSQLAIEHCYRARAKEKSKFILWIHASSAARFDQEVRKLVDDVNILGRQEKDANVYQLLRGWLNDPQRRWLVVLDGADDAEFLFHAPEVDSSMFSSTMARIDYLPVCSHGSLLVTTRRKAIAAQIVDNHNSIVLHTNEEHAIGLLASKLGSTTITSEVEKLSAALEYMPLAIAQAAAYINKMQPRCTIENYLAKLERSDRSKSNLMKLESDELRRDRLEAKNSILLTWQISFEHIHATRRSAADLLSLMSFFDYQGIHESLLQFNYNSAQSVQHANEGYDGDSDRNQDGSSDVSTDEPFESDVHTLRDYSFISVTSQGYTLETHRLVQLAAQLWLHQNQQYHLWEARSVQILVAAFPMPEDEQYEKCRALYPHARLMLTLKPEETNILLSTVLILSKAARFASFQGSYSEAEEMKRESLSRCEKVLGTQHSITLGRVHELAQTLVFRGKYEEAEELSRHALEGTKRILGEEHLHTLLMYKTLALALQEQGKNEGAEKIYRHALQGLKKVLGDQHLLTLRSLASLASVLANEGRYKHAEELYQRALKGLEKLRGTDHPDTLTTVADLAIVLYYQKKGEAAEEMARRALKGKEKVFGIEHPETLTIMETLAVALQNQGNYEAAADMIKRVLKGREKVLGKEHPSTLASLHNLARVLQDQGKYGTAEETAKNTLIKSEEVLGREHPRTLLTVWTLASICKDQDAYESAIELYEQAAAGFMKVLGPNHPHTKRCVQEWSALRSSCP